MNQQIVFNRCSLCLAPVSAHDKGRCPPGAVPLPLSYVGLFDIIGTDPPYREHVHTNATSQSKGRGTRKRDLGFEHISDPVRSAIGQWAAAVKRWSFVYSDVEDSYLLRIAAEEAGAEYIRTMPWVRWSMPNLTGTMPCQGFEHILLFHPKGSKRWNGPGNLISFNEWSGCVSHDSGFPLTELALRGEEKHKCEKPLDQALRLVSYFTEPGEKVFDPFSGHGTIPMACRLLGRSCSGFESDPEWAVEANMRLLGPLSDSDRERCERFLATNDEPTSALPDGPSLIRAGRRADDKARIRAALRSTR